MACLSRPTLSLAAARPAPAVQQQQQRVSARPAAVQRRASRRGRVAAAAGNGTSESSPVIGAPQQQHVIRVSLQARSRRYSTHNHITKLVPSSKARPPRAVQ